MTERSSVVRRQVDAFNAGDLDAFLATYADDARVDGVAPGEPLVGRAALRSFYAPRLATGLRCEVVEQVELGDRWVVAREVVGGAETLAVFEVVGGAIARAMIVREPPPPS